MQTIKKNDYHILMEDFKKNILYDGSQISPHYVADRYKIIGNSILVFRGGMKLSPKEMLDIKDVIREGHLAEILISTDDSINFIIEEFDKQPPNIELEYYRLRLLTQIVIEELFLKGISVEREGTDIYVEGKKLNVGIATTGLSSSKIHFGLNISNKGVPPHVEAVGLLEIGFKEDELSNWTKTIVEKYIEEIQKIKEDIVKTRSL